MATLRVTPSLARGLRPALVPPPTRAIACRHLKPRQLEPRRLPEGQRASLSSTGRILDNPPKPEIDHEAERKLAQQKLQADPSKVTTESTTRMAFDKGNSAITQSGDENMNKGLKHDIDIVKDTFRLDTIPKESHILGLAGTLPYFATSVSTLYFGWDLSKTLPVGNAYDSILISHETAKYLAGIMEPIQLGYGAVIISFMGAVHLGLEYAERTPLQERTRFRYAMAVIAPALAWPTIMMSVEYGLTAQFLTFAGLYFADAKAVARGWAPPWYGQYRFLLTAMVCLAIFVSLVGRSMIERSNRLGSRYLESSMNRPGIADKETNWAKLEAEDMKKEGQKKKQEQDEKKQEQDEKKQEQDEKKQEQDEKKQEQDEKKQEQDEKKQEQDEKKQEQDEKKQEQDEKKEGQKEEPDQNEKKSEERESSTEPDSSETEDRKSNLS